MTKVGTVTQVVEMCVYRGSATPMPKIIWDHPTYAQTI